ncbi:MAG: hypothetical protein ACLFTQ_02755 [Candidatus Aenigmatarchaeota archaeon]
MSVVEEFLEKGKLISPGAEEEVRNLEEKEVQDLLSSSSLVVGQEDIKRMETPQPVIESEEVVKKDEIHVSNFTEFYLERFKFLKEEIKQRMKDKDVSSIKNVSGGEASIIGMVRSQEDGKAVVEDNTGKITLRTPENFLEDEVIGATGKVIENEEVVMSPEKIFYPDVPLDKDVKSLERDLRALFVSEIDKNSEEKIKELNPDYVFSTGEVEDSGRIGSYVVFVSETPNEYSGTDPVRCDIEDLRILIHEGSAANKAQEELGYDRRKTVISLLKKRHLNPIEMHSLRDKYLLKEVPDIIHTSDGEDAAVNYKGVTLLSTTEETGFLVNLGTREIEEVEL